MRDIVRQAVLNTMGLPWPGHPFLEEIGEEVMRLIKAGDYGLADWPQEWGALPPELTQPPPSCLSQVVG